MSYSSQKGYVTKPQAGAQINWQNPLSRNLVARYLFNEGSGSRVNDISGKQNHGLIQNIGSNENVWSGSSTGGSVKFDGADHYVNIGTNIALPALTYIAWVKAVAFTNAYESIVDRQDPSQTVYSELFVKSNGKLACYVSAPAVVSYDGTGVNTLVINKDYQLTMSYDSTTGLKGYVNGRLDGSAAASGAIPTGAYNMFIGASPVVPNRQFNGIIEDVSIYSRVLSANEIYSLYMNRYQTILIPQYRRLLVNYVNLNINHSIPISHLISISQNGSIPLSHIISISKTDSTPVSHLLSVSTNGSIPLEHLVNISNISNLPLSHLLGISSTESVPLEHLIGLINTSSVPVEHLGSIVNNGTLPISHILNWTANHSLPVSSLLGVTNNSSIPLEHLANIARESNIPLSHLINIVNSGSMPLSHLIGLSSNGVLSLEHLAKAVVNGSIPVEWLLTEGIATVGPLLVWCLCNRETEWSLLARETLWTLAERSTAWTIGRNDNTSCD